MGMDREHLYKAKRVNWRELPEEEWWVEGDLLISDEDYYIIPDFGVSCVEKLNNYVCDKLITLHAFKVAPETVCEYTRLTDKNNKKIFEGDIIKINDDVKKVFGIFDGSVIYRGGSFIIGNSNSSGTLNSLFVITDINYVLRGEVIGNIFDNPKFLKGDVEE